MHYKQSVELCVYYLQIYFYVVRRIKFHSSSTLHGIISTQYIVTCGHHTVVQGTKTCSSSASEILCPLITIFFPPLSSPSLAVSGKHVLLFLSEQPLWIPHMKLESIFVVALFHLL